MLHILTLKLFHFNIVLLNSKIFVIELSLAISTRARVNTINKNLLMKKVRTTVGSSGFEYMLSGGNK